jgi:hypothetical protein
MADAPNLFHLSGDDLQITYSTSSLQGQPQFSYHDSTQSKVFSGDQIKVENSVMGTLVSVVINQTVDAGSTTFTVVIPAINLIPSSGGSPLSTVGIATLNKFKIFGQEPGQRSFYTVKPLQGTAMSVVF